MNTKKFIFAVFLILIIFFLIKSKKSIELEEVKNLDNVDIEYAYLNNEKIYIKQHYKHKYILFSADLSEISNKLNSGNLFANNIIKIKKEDIKKESEFSKDDNNYKKIPAIPKEIWENKVLRITFSELIKLIPKEKNKALLISMSNSEFLLYKDEKNNINFCYTFEKPNNVSIKKTISNQHINEIIIKTIKNNNDIMKYAIGNKILFQQNNNNSDHQIGLVDLHFKRVMYFDYWILYDFNKKVVDIFAYISLACSLVIKSHIYTIIKNPVTSFIQLTSLIKDHINKFFSEKKLIILDNIPEIVVGKEYNHEIDKILDKTFKNNIYKGKFKLLIDGDEYFLDLVKEIENAKQNIKFRLYIFDNDDYGTYIATLLRNVDKRGIETKVLIDSFANITKSIELPDLPFRESFKQPKSIKMYLKKGSDIEVKTSSNTWLTFDHVKTLLFDNKIAFTGGMNIGQEYRYSWHDVMAKIEGPVVKAISKEFDENWARNDLFGDLALLFQKIKIKNTIVNDVNAPINSIDIRLFYTKPWKKDIYKAQIIAIRNAKYRIYIENPYLADRRIINEIINARARGVDVRVILPKQNNVYLMAKNNNYVMNILLKNGIRVFLYPGMTHVKASIYDNLVMLGSANFDMLSYDINKELNIAFSDKNAVLEVEKRLFEKDFAISEELTSPNQINIGDEIFSRIANMF